jgi:DGQHR domain-containing protein
MEEDDLWPSQEKILPIILHRFGIEKKIQQKNQTDDEKKVPFWASAHRYDTSSKDWGETSIPLMKFEQSGKTHYFGVIQLGVADAICRVPSLAATTDTLEIARRTICNETTEQYQRPIQFPRIDNLNKFLIGMPTIVNPIILHIPESSKEQGSASIKQSENGDFTLKVNLKQVPFISRNGYDVDTKQGLDYRPVDLVDGQHRVRAARDTENSVNANVPFILLDETMSTNDAARIFAEINVQHEKLKDLHEMHLRYVLGLPSHLPDSDFGLVSGEYVDSKGKEGAPEMRQRYANRLAYRIGAKLTADESGPLYSIIRYFDNHAATIHAIDAKQWVKYASQWILQRYGPQWEEKEVLELIHCYFQAWKNTANLNPDTGAIYEDAENVNRWGMIENAGRGPDYKSRAFDGATFKALMSLFPTCIQLSKAEKLNSPEEKINAFMEILTPCQSIDFGDVGVWKNRIFAVGKPDEIEAHLYHWMAWAIREYARTGKKIESSLAWNTDEGTDIDSAPGQGFFSGVNTSHFSGMLRIENLNSSTEINGMTITIEAEPMPNESRHKTITVEYRDRKDKIRSINRMDRKFKGPYKKVGYNKFTQTMGTGPDKNIVKTLIVTITSGNLYAANTTVFRQEYTVNELKNLNGREIYLTSQTRSSGEESEDLTFTEMKIESVGDTGHYEIQTKYPREDLDEEEDIFEDVEEPDEYDFADNILPMNRFKPESAYVLSRKSNPCQQCFHGNDHRCGYQ